MHLVTDRGMVPSAQIKVRQPCTNDCPNHGNGDTVWYLVTIQQDQYSDLPGPTDRYWACSGLSPDDFDT